jgi:hypothetical protein
VIGTFGRSAWVLDDIRPLREIARNGTEELDQTINIYPVPDAYLAEERQAAGMRFAADAVYSGENRPSGARFTYSVSELPDDEEEQVIVEIFNSEGEKIRTLEEKPKHIGINRMTWNLDEKGVRGPSRRLPAEDAPEPGGPDVLPGEYTVKMSYAGQSDSTTVKVHFDPRIEYNMADLRAKRDMEGDLMALRATAAEATNRLHKANTMLETAEQLLKDDEEHEALQEQTQAVKESISELLDQMLGKEDDRQGITRNPEPSVQTHLREPYWHLRSAIGGLSSTERKLMDHAEKSVKETVTRINQFFENEWSEYVETVEDSDLTPFRPIETVEL